LDNPSCPQAGLFTYTDESIWPILQDPGSHTHDEVANFSRLEFEHPGSPRCLEAPRRAFDICVSQDYLPKSAHTAIRRQHGQDHVQATKKWNGMHSPVPWKFKPPIPQSLNQTAFNS
jgi:hypothetical protein